MPYRIQITTPDGTVYPIYRDVCHTHPDAVHQQLGTSSEAELQQALDGVNVRDWYRDGVHLGPDVCGLEMFDGNA